MDCEEAIDVPTAEEEKIGRQEFDRSGVDPEKFKAAEIAWRLLGI